MALNSSPMTIKTAFNATTSLFRLWIFLRCVATVAMLSVYSMNAQPIHAAETRSVKLIPSDAVTANKNMPGANSAAERSRIRWNISTSVNAISRWIMTTQSDLNRALIRTIRILKQDPWWGSVLLVTMAFAYGILHAAGPGHGKAVISSYVLANGTTARRGVALSFLAAAIQAIAALILVGILVFVLGQYGRSALAAERWLEIASWGAIALVGTWLLYRQLEYMFGLSTGRSHTDGCACPEHHLPPAHLLSGDWSWYHAFAIALSVGIRPCTGAILLLIFAIGQGLFWAGVIGTLAMAFGTALTVSVLALMAVYARHWSIALWGQQSQIGDRIAGSLTLLASVLIIVVGLAGMHAAMTAPRMPNFLLVPRG